MSDFETWWKNEGSGIVIIKGHDIEEHAQRLSSIAWENGVYKATYCPKKRNADEMYKALSWFIEQFQGESGAGENYWEDCKDYALAKETLAKAGGKES